MKPTQPITLQRNSAANTSLSDASSQLGSEILRILKLHLRQTANQRSN